MTGLCLAWDTVPRAVGFTSHCQTEAGGLVTDESEAHTLVLSPTGGGKGRNFILPNLLFCDAATVVVDVKGEAAMVTAEARRRMGHEVVIIDPFAVVPGEQRGSLNPLELITEASLGDDALTLAHMISGDRRSNKEPFWDDCAEDLVAGAIAEAALKGGTLVDVWNRLTEDDQAFSLATSLDKGVAHSFIHKQYASFLAHEGERVRSSVLSVARQHLRLLAGTSVQDALAKTSFSIDRLRRGEKITVYIVIPPTRLNSHSGLLRLWLSMLLNVIAGRSEMPTVPTIFLIDELAHLGEIAEIRDAVTLLRGYGLKACLFLQSYGQLKNLFPHDHETIAENCGTILTFGHTNMSMSTTIAEMLGDVSASMLFNMAGSELAVRIRGGKTRVARRVDYLKDRMFDGLFAPNPYYQNRRSVTR